MSFITKIPDYCPADVRLAIGNLEEADSAEWLTESEQKFYDALSNSRRQKEFLSVRMLLKKLGSDLGFEPKKFHIQKDGLGKPFGVVEDKQVYLSLAHSNQKVLCGLSERRNIGVDLEPVSRSVDKRLGRRLFHPEEVLEIRNLELVRLWTIKEALVKLYGGGLRTNLKDIRVSRIESDKFLARFDNDKSAIICSFQQEEHWVSVSYYQ